MTTETGTTSGQTTTSATDPGTRGRTSVTTLEEMKGYFTVGPWDTVTDEHYQRALRQGRRDNTFVLMHLELTADDIEAHLADPTHQMRIGGWIRADSLWGRSSVTGTFGLFVPTANPALRRMEYRFTFDGKDAGALTLIGFKEVSEYLYTSVMEDSQTLYCRIYQGSVSWDDADTTPVWAVGILNLHWSDFVRYDIFGLRFRGPDRLKWGLRFLRFFLGSNYRLQRLKRTGRRD
jgi:cholesterol oxidase